MIDTRTLRRTGLTLAPGLALAACAQQPGTAAPQASGQSTQGHDMSGMSMQQMMAHWAEMRQQMQSGATMGPEMRAMMSRCDQMSGQPAVTSTVPTTGQSQALMHGVGSGRGGPDHQLRDYSCRARSLRALPMTDTELSAMASAATIGLSSRPRNG